MPASLLKSVTYADGWALIPNGSMDRLTDFWHPPRIHPERHVPDYHSEGVTGAQWVNFTHNRAALLTAEGTPEAGGRFRLWFSLGVDTVPLRVDEFPPHEYSANAPRVTIATRNEAISDVESLLGLRRISGGA